MIELLSFMHIGACISMLLWLLIACLEWNGNYMVRMANSREEWFVALALFGYIKGAVVAAIAFIIFSNALAMWGMR